MLLLKYNKFPQIHVHRGLAEKAPENTLSAFQMAVDSGVDGIELDLHYTRDCKIVVHHDYYLGRTNNGSGLISDKSYEVGESCIGMETIFMLIMKGVTAVGLRRQKKSSLLHIAIVHADGLWSCLRIYLKRKWM